MLQLSVREFNKNISKALKNIPVEITNRGVVIAKILPPDTIWSSPEGNPKSGLAKYMNIKKEDLKGGIEVDMKKAREGMAGANNPGLGRVPMSASAKKVNPEVKLGTKGVDLRVSPKNAGERSSVTEAPSHSATPPPLSLKIAREIDEASSKIPFLRKKLCPKHSVFSCGCTEKEGKGEQR